MCRLFAVSSAAPAAWDYYMLRAPIPFRSFGDKRNPDGWGMGWYDDDMPILFKELRPAPSSRVFAPMASTAVTRMLIAHLRKASHGSLRRRNCHPFGHSGWFFAHNGTIKEIETLKSALSRSYRSAITSETDSEIFFYTILRSIAAQKGDVKAGIKEVVSKLPNFVAANFLMTDGKRLFAYRDPRKKIRHFSLYYKRVMRPAPGRPATPHVVISSNKLTDEPWQSIPCRHLLTVEEDLSVSLEKLYS